MKRLLVALAMFSFILSHPDRLVAQTPPYWGTIFIESGILTASDPSTIQSTTYKGRGSRVVFDRRTNNWETINAYLFSIVWNDGLQTEAIVNPEFGTMETARIEAEKYGFLVGQIPNVLRKDVRGLWIHKGVEAFGGGNYSILIHTGQAELYEKDGILEETLVHEASHTSLDAYHATSDGWKKAQNSDNHFISTYAKDNPVTEDVAESFLLWLAVRYMPSRISSASYNTILKTIPNRLKYFDEQAFNLSPVKTLDTSINPVGDESVFSIYPNPVLGELHIDSKKAILQSRISITDNSGRIVYTREDEKWNHITANLENLQPGIYYLAIFEEKGKHVYTLLKE